MRERAEWLRVRELCLQAVLALVGAAPHLGVTSVPPHTRRTHCSGCAALANPALPPP